MDSDVTLEEQDRIFQDNLEKFSLTQPKLAYQLDLISTDHWEPFLSDGQFPNLKHATEDFSLHSNNPEKEAKEWFCSLNLANTNVLHIYGIGLGYYYTVLKTWLAEDASRHLVFLEDDPAVLFYLFHTLLGSEILQCDQVDIRPFTEKDSSFLGTLTWDYLLEPYQVSALLSYQNNKADQYQTLVNSLSFEQHSKDTLVEEYLDHGASYYANFYANLLHLHQSYHGNALFNQFKGVPAIICGAGPSLAKVLPLLPGLKDRALILAGGSAINALNSIGLDPHFGAGIDPNSAQYDRLVANTSFEIPFFYRGRMHRHAFRLIHGPRLYINGGGGYTTPEWFEDTLGIRGLIVDEGHNVVNFCTSIAFELSCNPIIFVGLDLAYTNMQAYAPGVIADTSMTRQKIEELGGADNEAVERLDIHGQPIVTLWKWILESEWAGQFAEEHPEVRLINCTDGGLGCPGIPNVPLEEVIKEFATIKDLDLVVWNSIQKARMADVTRTKVLRSLNDLVSSLENCQNYCQTIIKQLKKKRPDKSQLALSEVNLEEEIAYAAVLSIFHEVYVRSQNGARIRAQRIEDANEKKRALNELDIKVMEFLNKTAAINVHLIKNSIEQYQPIE